MAGISVTLDGDNIQLSFQKGGQSTAVVMDPHAARSLVKALDQLLVAIGESAEEVEEGFEEMVDVTSPTIDIGTDESGLSVIALEAGDWRRSCCACETRKRATSPTACWKSSTAHRMRASRSAGTNAPDCRLAKSAERELHYDDPVVERGALPASRWNNAM